MVARYEKLYRELVEGAPAEAETGQGSERESEAAPTGSYQPTR